MICALMASEPAFAQDRARGLTLDFSQGLEASTNPELAEDASDEFVLQSDVGLTYTTATRTQRLTFGIGAQLEAGHFAEAGTDARVAERRVGLNYTRTAASGRLEVSAAYSRARVEDTVPDEGFVSEDLEVVEGERGVAQFGMMLETGRDRLIGTEVRADLSSVRYFENDEDGRDEVDLEAALRLAAGPRTDLLLLSTLSRRDDKSEDEYEAQASSVGVGVRHAFTARQRIRADLRKMRRETSEIDLGVANREVQDGFGGGFGYEIDIGRSTLGANYDNVLTPTGRQQLLNLSHETASEAGALRVAIGVVESDFLDAQPLLNIDWTRNLQSSQIRLSLSQDADGSADDDQETILTRLSASYLGRINSVSSWEVQLNLAEADEYGVDADDNRRSDITLGYRRAVAPDWDLTLRYRHVLSEANDGGDRSNDSLFLGLATRVDLW